MPRPRLICCFCQTPIRKSHDNFDERYDVTTPPSQIQRAWHRECEPTYVPPDSPFQAAVQKAKQSIEDARRLGPDAFGDFVAIVRLALTEPR